MNIAKFLRTAFFIEHLWWLLLVTAINRRLNHNWSQNKFASHSLLLTWFDIGNYNEGKKVYVLNIGVCHIANQNFPII